jgi:CRP-like cAMP-binding protein
MAKHDTSDNVQSTYHYLHFTPEELAHLPPAELLQACLESRSLLQIILGILLSSDANPTERIVACDLIYAQAMRLANEPKSDESEDVVADVKTVSERLGLRPSAVRAAYEALAERGAVRIDERVLPKQRHQLSLPLDQSTSTDASKK